MAENGFKMAENGFKSNNVMTAGSHEPAKKGRCSSPYMIDNMVAIRDRYLREGRPSCTASLAL